jgi:hypothetical protein
MFSGSHAPRTPNPPHWANVPSSTCTPSHPVCHDIFYAGGGRSVHWVGPNDSPQLYPDSPGTQMFAQYTPECAEFTSRPTQYTPMNAHVSSRGFLPTPCPSSSQCQQSPTPLSLDHSRLQWTGLMWSGPVF